VVATHRVRDDGGVDVPAQQPQPDPSLLRASDADRDRVADQLREALAEGRLTPEEHAERIETVYTAKTYAELAPLLADLPSAKDAQATPLRGDLPAPVQQSASIVAVFSGAERRGRWLVEPHTNVFTLFGGVELDLREAVLSQREVTMNITCIFGGVDIKVPPGVRVIHSGATIFGGYSQDNQDAMNADAPVIRITGFNLFGGVEVKHRLPRSERRDLRDERRRLRDERREHLRELRDARHDHRHHRGY
jgi:hypothetical protein